MSSIETRKSTSPITSFFLLADPATLKLTTSFIFLILSLTNSISFITSLKRNLFCPCLKNLIDSKIFCSVFSPKPKRGAILLSSIAFSKSFKFLIFNSCQSFLIFFTPRPSTLNNSSKLIGDSFLSCS